MANSPSAISAAASRKCQSVCLSAVATLALVRAKNDLLLPLRLAAPRVSGYPCKFESVSGSGLADSTV